MRVFCAYISSTKEAIVAAHTKKCAAKLLGMSVYKLDSNRVDYSSDSNAGKVALCNPGVVFTKKKFDESWFPTM